MIDIFEGLNILYMVFVCMIGISIGSFLNVIIYRVPKNISFTKGFSKCPACDKQLKAFDLIPLLSYLSLKKKCRYCGVKISSRYFWVEFLTGIIFLSLFLRYGLSPEFVAFSFFSSVLIAVFFIDYDEMIIPNGLVITGLIGGFALFIYNYLWTFEYYGNIVWWTPLLAMLLGPLVLIILAIVGSAIFKADAMGGGDIKLFAPIGLFLGLKMTVIALFFSFIIAGIIGIFLLLLKKKERKSAIPFGPFIVMATYLTMMWGNQILEWYLYGY